MSLAGPVKTVSWCGRSWLASQALSGPSHPFYVSGSLALSALSGPLFKLRHFLCPLTGWPLPGITSAPSFPSFFPHFLSVTYQAGEEEEEEGEATRWCGVTCRWVGTCVFQRESRQQVWGSPAESCPGLSCMEMNY